MSVTPLPRQYEPARTEGLVDKDDKTQDPDMNERLARLEGELAGLKVVKPMTLTVFGVILAAIALVIGLLASQVQSLNAKFDAIPRQLTEEFRAMRQEMSAQTTAIASSITAARQVQPQIVIMPHETPTPAK